MDAIHWGMRECMGVGGQWGDMDTYNSLINKKLNKNQLSVYIFVQGFIQVKFGHIIPLFKLCLASYCSYYKYSNL